VQWLEIVTEREVNWLFRHRFEVFLFGIWGPVPTGKNHRVTTLVGRIGALNERPGGLRLGAVSRSGKPPPPAQSTSSLLAVVGWMAGSREYDVAPEPVRAGGNTSDHRHHLLARLRSSSTWVSRNCRAASSLEHYRTRQIDVLYNVPTIEHDKMVAEDTDRLILRDPQWSRVIGPGALQQMAYETERSGHILKLAKLCSSV
jgi:hypothetical protein